MIRAIKSIDWRSLRVRLLTVTGVSMALCFGVWCWQGWRNDTRTELATLSAKLEAIAATAGVALNGDLHQDLEPQMPAQPKAGSVPEDYRVLQETLAMVAERNELEGEIVTLVAHEDGLALIEADPGAMHAGAFDLFVTSQDHPRWRETVDYVPAMRVALFEGRAASARTANGALAAYAPLFDSFGGVAGVVRTQVPWSSSILYAYLFLAGRLAFAGAALTVILRGANAMTKRNLRPLDAIEEAAGNLAAGDWKTPIEIKTKTSELVVLGSALEGLRLEVQVRLTDERRANEKLVESKRLAEGNLAGQADVLTLLGREIHDPLMRFKTALRDLEGVPMDGASRERLDAALRQGYDLSAKVEHTLQLARLRGGDKQRVSESFDLAEIVERAASPFRIRAQENNLSFRVVMPETVSSSLLGDPGAIREILGELLENASRATQEGSITLRVWPTTSPEEGVLLRFEVADTGTGIEPEQSERIERALSERMDFVRRERDGHGLARAAELVHLHGGELAFETRPGTGTRFWFFAKFQDPRALAATPTGMPEPPAALPSRTPANRSAPPTAQSITSIQDAS